MLKSLFKIKKKYFNCTFKCFSCDNDFKFTKSNPLKVVYLCNNKYCIKNLFCSKHRLQFCYNCTLDKV